MKYTEIDQNRIIILQKTCNRGALHQTDTQTHRPTEIHTFFIWYPRVGREHNSPSGNKSCKHGKSCITESVILSVAVGMSVDFTLPT